MWLIGMSLGFVVPWESSINTAMNCSSFYFLSLYNLLQSAISDYQILSANYHHFYKMFGFDTFMNINFWTFPEGALANTTRGLYDEQNQVTLVDRIVTKVTDPHLPILL